MSIINKSTELQSSTVMKNSSSSRSNYSIMTNIGKWMFRSLVLATFSTQMALGSDSYTPISNSSLSATAPIGAAGFSATKPESSKDQQVKSANFGQETASVEARQIADWIVNSNNNGKLPFVIIDKPNAKVFAFTQDGQLRGAAPVLLGLSRADDNVPGIGSKKLSAMRVDERTTPAGRFESFLATNLRGEEIFWVDYNTSVALHRVHTHNLKERRGERLASPTIADNRISFGCVNVPVAYYTNVISKTFQGTKGISYVLPETKSLAQVFGSYGFVTNNNKLASNK